MSGAPEGGHPTRRQVLLGGGAAALAVAAGGAAVLVGRDSEPSPLPTPSEPPEALPTNTSAPGTEDETARLQALLDEGSSRVVIPPGTHVLSATLVVPWAVETVELPAGAVLHMRGDHVVLRRTGTVDERARVVTQAEEGAEHALLEADGVQVGSWLYLCADDWVKEGKSKVGMLRQVTAVDGDRVVLDRPLIRTLTQAPRAHLVDLAPPLSLVGAGAIENSDPQATFENLVRLDFVDGITVEGVELRQCGGAALRTFATVGGRVDCYIHDCVDDQNNNHFGYGVSASSATRDLVVAGTIERVRHAFTTDHGWGAPIESIARTGEPENIEVTCVARDTTSTGIDTHEVGYGIRIVPDVRNAGTRKWGGVNVRARNVTIEGGAIQDSNEWGVLVQPSASGTVIRDVEISGVRIGRGVHCKSDAEISGVTVRNFGEAYGIEITEGVAVTMTGTAIEGSGTRTSRGIILAGDGCTLQGMISDCGIGVFEMPVAGRNSLQLEFRNVAREWVRP